MFGSWIWMPHRVWRAVRGGVDGSHAGKRVGVGWKMGGADAPTGGRGARYKTPLRVYLKIVLSYTTQSPHKNHVTYDMFHAILELTTTEEAPTTCL